MVVALLLLAWTQSESPEKELSAIVERLGSADAARRSEASDQLEAFCRKHRAKAPEYLQKHLAAPDAEVRSRIQAQLGLFRRLEEFRDELRAFDEAGLPDCTGKKFAIYNPNSIRRGGNNEESFQYVVGWILSETPGEVTILDADLTTRVYPRDRKLPDQWNLIKAGQPPGLPLPGEYVAVHLREFAKDFFIPPGTTYALKESWNNNRFIDLCFPGLELAHFSYRALLEGEEKLARVLADHAKSTYAGWGIRFRDMAFRDIVRQEVANHLREQAIDQANHGRPRSELLKEWKRVDAIAPLLNRGEPRDMVRMYEQLLSEDAAWKNPTNEDMARMAPAARAAVWIHRLRDLVANQHTIPGSCLILGTWGRHLEENLNPAQELVKLGWDALPLVIDLLDDRRPTRCEAGDMGPLRLLRVGDCCRQIFEAVTGYTIYEPQGRGAEMVQDGYAPASKEKALKWWEEHGKTSPEQYLLQRLGTKEGLHPAAVRLLQLDEKKYAPVLLDLLEKGDRETRGSLLPLVRSFLTRAHQPLLEKVLQENGLPSAILAAEALWTLCGKDSGAQEVLRRLENAPPEDEQPFFGTFDVVTEERLTALFRSISGDQVIERIVGLLKSPRVLVRSTAFRCAAALPHRRTAEALLDLLAEESHVGWSSGYLVRYCDAAALALRSMLRLPDPVPPGSELDDRNRMIRDLKTWWGKNRESIDWKDLRRKADEARMFTK